MRIDRKMATRDMAIWSAETRRSKYIATIANPKNINPIRKQTAIPTEVAMIFSIDFDAFWDEGVA
jgi:hypothetical protein